MVVTVRVCSRYAFITRILYIYYAHRHIVYNIMYLRITRTTLISYYACVRCIAPSGRMKIICILPPCDDSNGAHYNAQRTGRRRCLSLVPSVVSLATGSFFFHSRNSRVCTWPSAVQCNARVSVCVCVCVSVCHLSPHGRHQNRNPSPLFNWRLFLCL
jgi:hypothetical protein